MKIIIIVVIFLIVVLIIGFISSLQTGSIDIEKYKTNLYDDEHYPPYED